MGLFTVTDATSDRCFNAECYIDSKNKTKKLLFSPHYIIYMLFKCLSPVHLLHSDYCLMCVV